MKKEMLCDCDCETLCSPARSNILKCVVKTCGAEWSGVRRLRTICCEMSGETELVSEPQVSHHTEQTGQAGAAAGQVQEGLEWETISVAPSLHNQYNNTTQAALTR